MATQQTLNGMDGLAVRQPSIGEILALAVEKSAGAEAIERLVNLQQQLIQREAEREFNEAMNAVQAELSPIRPTLENPETHSKYASYTQLDRVLRPIYTKHGFSLSFGTLDCPIPEHVRIVCYVSRGGFTRPYQCDISADGKGPKGGAVMSKTHASGSAMSYGMRYLLKMIFNVAIGEDDNDGNGEVEDWVQDHLDNIRAQDNLDGLRYAFKEAYTATANMPAQKLVVKLYEARKRELR